MFSFQSEEYVSKKEFKMVVDSISSLLKEKDKKIKNLSKIIDKLETTINSKLTVDEKYPILYEGFISNLTTKQLEQIVPKSDRIGKSKQHLVNSLFRTLKRKTEELDNDFNEIFTDRFKFPISLIEYLELYNEQARQEWFNLVKDIHI